MANPTIEEKLSNQLDDVQSYAILTEDIGVQRAVRSGSPTAAGASPIGQTVENALREVLGWRTKNNDARGFVAALNQSFALEHVGGHTEWKWTPRSYAIAAEMGAVTGAQASIYTRSRSMLDQSLPLLDGLYPLNPAFDLEDSEAIRAIVKSTLNELVGELGREGGPRVARVDELFELLLGGAVSLSDQEQVGGQTGLLGDRFGLRRQNVNTIAEEQNLTNFLILVDNTTCLRQTWNAQRHFFDLRGNDVFLGTQLVLLSRALAVVAESVEESYFAMDSVFLSAAERQVTELKFPSNTKLPPIFVADLLTWVEQFATEEGPRLIREGGKDGVITAFSPTVKKLKLLVREAVNISKSSSNNPTRALHTARVQRALTELSAQLEEAAKLADQIQRVPNPKPHSVIPESVPVGETARVFVEGKYFRPGEIGTRVKLDLSESGGRAPDDPEVYGKDVVVISDTLLSATFNLDELPPGSYTVVVINPDGRSGSRDHAFSINALNGSSDVVRGTDFADGGRRRGRREKEDPDERHH